MARSTERKWWQNMMIPQQEILEDMIVIRRETGSWPGKTDFGEIRHINKELDWVHYFISYREALYEANELWESRTRGDRSTGSRGSVAPVLPLAKYADERAPKMASVETSKASALKPGNAAKTAEVNGAPTSGTSVLDHEETVKSLMFAISRCDGMMPTSVEIDHFVKTIPGFPTMATFVSQLGPKSGWLAKLNEYRELKRALAIT